MTTATIETDTLVVGAGQAGIAMSEHLSALGVPHLVLEKKRIAEAWRSGRWDSLVANGPSWHDRFPNLEFKQHHPDAFVPKEQVADYFVEYVKQINAPVKTGVEVLNVSRHSGGFSVETTDGTIKTRHIVAATGPFQVPVMPAIAPQDDALYQIHSAHYYNPEQLPEGAVLVVGAGSSGVQIADEIRRSGKTVYLSVGAHDRPPRTYRGRDNVWWLGVLGEWEREMRIPGKEHVTIAVSGAHGGHTVDFRRLAADGMMLVGSTRAFENGTALFNDDLARNIANGDANYLSVLDAADAYIAANGLDLPEEPAAREFLPDPECVTQPILELDLAQAGITSIIWATGYGVDYTWLNSTAAVGADGKPQHHRGVSAEPGVYFLGLPWLMRRGSSFIWGAWQDAKVIASHIDTQRRYCQYQGMAEKITTTPLAAAE